VDSRYLYRITTDLNVCAVSNDIATLCMVCN